MTSFTSINHISQQKKQQVFVYNVYKNSIISFIDGHSLYRFQSDSLDQKSIAFSVDGHENALRIHDKQVLSIGESIQSKAIYSNGNIIYFKEKTFLIIDDNIDFLLNNDKEQALKLLLAIGGNIFLLNNLDFKLLRNFDKTLLPQFKNKGSEYFDVGSDAWFYLEFFDPLISPTDEIDKITIIPDGMLNYIPFEVLIEVRPKTHQMKERNYKNLAFILKKYSINYNYSSTLWMNNKQDNQLHNNGKCLGFAPSIQFGNQDSLPWAQKELKAIEAIFEGEYYYGAAANKSLFRKRSDKFSIIHLATHGIVNMKNPMRSLLSLAASDTSNQDLTALYAYEIYNLSINADLVVLSACETGFGKAVRGEGVLSLARAFLHAGAPSVVTTLWEVNDFTSAALIETLFSTSLGLDSSARSDSVIFFTLSDTGLIADSVVNSSYKRSLAPTPRCTSPMTSLIVATLPPAITA